eukprot:Gb_10476 [translate_table: standard]
MRTPGFSGDDLTNLLNEAAILTGGRKIISRKEIDDAINRIVAGIEGTSMTNGKSKILVAYHEVGHVIYAKSNNQVITPALLQGIHKNKIFLIWFIDIWISCRAIFAHIVGSLGGRATEEIIFGKPEVTSGTIEIGQGLTKLVFNF